MKTQSFKTNIKCMGCVSQVTPYLNQTAGENNWEVDINNPQKTLTVKAGADAEAIKTAVEKAGFKAEAI